MPIIGVGLRWWQYLVIAARVLLKALCSATLCFCAMMLASCSASPPGRAETAVMTRVKRWTTGGRKLANPQAATAENIAAGKEAFSHYCAACHGLVSSTCSMPSLATRKATFLFFSSSDMVYLLVCVG